jgi:hypothetical protein
MRQRQSFAIILVGKSILLREGLAKILRSANFRILASVSASMICSRAKSNYTSRCFSLFIPATTLAPRWNKSNCLRTSTPAGALPS